MHTGALGRAVASLYQECFVTKLVGLKPGRLIRGGLITGILRYFYLLYLSLYLFLPIRDRKSTSRKSTSDQTD